MDKQEKTCHVVVIPYPVQGHMNPMIQFSKLLAAKGLHVTLVIFSSKTLLTDHASLGSVKVVAISDSYDRGSSSISDYLQQFQATVTQKLPRLVVELGISSGHPVSCLVYDSFMPWVLEIARKLGLTGASFFTQSCAVNSVYYQIHEGQLKIPPEKFPVSVPGLPALDADELPSFVHSMEPEYSPILTLVVNQFINFKEADWIFVNTFNSLEEEVVNWLETQRSIKPIGPMIPSVYLDRQLEDDREYGLSLFKPALDGCMEWLDSKEPGSVVYVSFGSLAALGEEQMAEIAWGLRRSGCYFLWVVRESEEKKLPCNFAEDSSEKGLIVSWSPQLQVLAHKSVGCFMTHCGWNSTLEALSLGVPMVAMPQWTDQPTNAKYIADVWRVGVRLQANEKGIITKEELEKCTREVMGGETGDEMRRNSEKWKKLAMAAVGEGGSSDKNITEFAAKLASKFESNEVNHVSS
ncbi:UDP-glycosyltransferase 74E [Salix suchowensis]|nr:UDP-glycosyltransferase 74E [Salix suchowensis]